jgi:cyanophycin synthetase
MAGLEVGFGKARETHQRGIYKVVVRARQYDVAHDSLLAARDLVMAAINDTPFDVAATVNRLKAVADRLCLGPSTASIVDAAAQRGIPSIRLTEGNLVQLGHGSRQRRIWTAETDRTSAVAESISRDKDLTKRLLAQCGVPIPEGRIVDSPEQAWAMAQDMGLPVVIKPSDGNHGRGVALDLNSQHEIEAAWRVADAEGSQVMVERFVRGEEHRLLVVGDKVVAAARGELACITGDGVTTVALLIEQQLNTDPRRGEEEHFPLDTIRLDEQPHAVLELQRQGLNADSIPAQGRRVIVQRNGNMSNDVTDLVHPDVAELARGKSGRVVGHLMGLITLMKGQPLAYNKDNQEDKEPLFDTVDTVRDTLRIMAEMVAGIIVKPEAMERAALKGYATATDLADYLVKKGLPFRDAHEAVAHAVKHAIGQGVDLSALPLSTLQGFHASITDDVFEVLTLRGSLNARNVLGGTAPAQVRAQVTRHRTRLS